MSLMITKSPHLSGSFPMFMKDSMDPKSTYDLSQTKLFPLQASSPSHAIQNVENRQEDALRSFSVQREEPQPPPPPLSFKHQPPEDRKKDGGRETFRPPTKSCEGWAAAQFKRAADQIAKHPSSPVTHSSRGKSMGTFPRAMGLGFSGGEENEVTKERMATKIETHQRTTPLTPRTKSASPMSETYSYNVKNQPCTSTLYLQNNSARTLPRVLAVGPPAARYTSLTKPQCLPFRSVSRRDAGDSSQLERSIAARRSLAVTDFDLGVTVGTGTFGRVRVVKLKGSSDRTPMALKMMRKSEVLRLRQVEHVKAEKDILSQIRHPFIVNLLASFQDSRRLYMLMEYINGGELFSHLRRQHRLCDSHAQFYAAEIVLVFEYLHERNIVYRDLKPENILLDRNGHVKVTDFGFAKVVHDRTWTLCGTPEYLAPEIIQSRGHSKSADWWALGILIYEMLCGYPPFYDENPLGIYHKVLAGRVEWPSHLDSSAQRLLRGLLSHDRTKRYGCLKGGAEDVKRHKWFRGVDWEKCIRRELSAPFVPKVSGEDDTSQFDFYPESKGRVGVEISKHEQDHFFADF